MPRQYTKRLPQEAYTERSRKAAAVRESTDNVIRKLAARELTPEQAARVRALLAEFPAENETAGGRS
ncbi:hypothetical protein O3Q52_16655 [Streptomyces sp. ActVer]|uniref:hypothetical protein n=1 Tax=Streptomyces sp. ActVer TaxID=3014558 RepID=UPI0022B4F7EB|nr:hypothetical protein [Streptomyces sp. ActVer]MCZ4509797.1 hypothetical protein [Streptomyces sp. ActVer]